MLVWCCGLSTKSAESTCHFKLHNSSCAIISLQRGYFWSNDFRMFKVALNIALFGAFLLMVVVFGFFLWQTLFTPEEYGSSEPQRNPAYTEQQSAKEEPPPTLAKAATDEAIAKYTKWLAISTMLLVLATGLLYVSGERNVDVARQSVRVAQVATKAATDIATKALVAGQRAWIRIDDITIGGGGLSISKDGVTAPIAFVVTNIGNSPAIKLSHHAKLIATAAGVSVPEEQAKICDQAKSQRWESGFTLFPNEQFPRNLGVGQYSYGTNLSKEEIERGLEASKDKKHLSLIVVGCVDYTFSTDPDTHHQTPFIRTINKNEPSLISIEDNLIPPGKLLLREFGLAIGRPAD
jgi:hypothetical protein